MAAIYLSDRQVAERYNTHKTTPWRWAKTPTQDFPQPVQLSAGCTRWRLSDLEAWEQAKTTAA